MAKERARDKDAAREGGKTAADLKLEQLFNDLEGKARAFLRSVEAWVDRGDDLLGKGKAWLDDHPVAVAMANKYSRKVPYVPHTTGEARAAVDQVGVRVKRSARRGLGAARANPVEAALVGGALGVIALVALRGR